MLKLPAPLIKIWQEGLNAFAKKNTVPAKDLKELRALWTTYNEERQAIGRTPLGHLPAAVAYLRGFHLANSARFYGLWQRLLTRLGPATLQRLLQQDVYTYDVGCGTGALASTFTFLRQTLRAKGAAPTQDTTILLDQARHPLTIAAHLLAQTTNHKIIPVLGGVNTLRPLKNPAGTSGLHVYLMGYLWNEIYRNPSAKKHLLQTWQKLLQNDEEVMLFFLEPAHEESARQLIELRDELVEQGFSALYPCPLPNKLCPMGSRGRDWCYSEFLWDRPPVIQKIDRQLHIDRSMIAAAAYVFVSPAVATRHFKDLPHHPVTVGRPIDQREKKLLQCDGNAVTKNPLPRGNIKLRGDLA